MWSGDLDSSSSKKKGVSLGGKSKKRDDKELFAEKVKEERRMRDLIKKKEMSSITIQSSFRRHRLVRIEKEKQRKAFDDKITDLNTLAQYLLSTKNISYVPVPVNALDQLVREINYAFDSYVDSSRIAKMCDLLMLNATKQTQDPKANVLFNANDADSCRQWVARMKKLLSHCFTVLDLSFSGSMASSASASTSDATSSLSASSIVRIMEFVSLILTVTPESAQNLWATHPDPSSPSLRYSLLQLKLFTLGNSDYQIKKSNIINKKRKNTQAKAKSLFSAFIECINSDSAHLENMTSLVANFLYSISMKDADKVSFNIFAELLTKGDKGIADMFTRFSEKGDMIHLIALDAAEEWLASKSEKTIDNYLAVFVNTSFAMNMLQSQQGFNDAYDSIFQRYLVLWSKLIDSIPFNNIMGGSYAKRLQIVLEPKFFRDLFRWCLQKPSMEIENTYSFSWPKIKSATTFGSAVATNWNQTIQGSSFSPSSSCIAAAAFQYGSQHSLRPNICEFWTSLLSQKMLVQEILNDYTPTISFFCAATNILIASLDDNELFKSFDGRYFTQVELAKISILLRDILYQEMWINGQNDKFKQSSLKMKRNKEISKYAAHLRQVLVRNASELFVQLYERSLNNPPFMSPNEWLFPPVPLMELGMSSSAKYIDQETNTAIGFNHDNDDEDDDNQHGGEATNNRNQQNWFYLDDDDEDSGSGDGNDMELVNNASASSSSASASTALVSETATERGRNILRKIPYVIPFSQRLQLFHQLVDHVQANEEHFQRVPVSVTRQNMFEDAFNALRFKDLRKPLSVSFTSENGLIEAGIDGGGLTKEFITQFCLAAFDTSSDGLRLFQENEKHYFFPNPRPNFELGVEHFEFVGKMLGKAVYEGILIGPVLAPFVMNLILGKKNRVHDLQNLDDATYLNLMKLKKLSDIDAVDLTFTVTTNIRGYPEEVNLLPKGNEIKVTRENCVQYILRYADYRLNQELKPQCDAFVRGFTSIISPSWIRMFSAHELQSIIGGSDDGFDIKDLESAVVYSGGYHPSQPYIHEFWEVLASFTPEEKGKFLQFVTSCPRPPLHGFRSLSPPITIFMVRNSPDRLPTASTCVNLLKLPQYETKEKLKEKLLYSITSGSGFELS